MFISFEGGNGSGKSTQARLLCERLNDSGIEAVLIHEPGNTILGNHLREYLKSERPLSVGAELLLFEASRAELVSSVIKPYLQAGMWVIVDRFKDSTVAYQGYGQGVDLQVIDYINSFVTQGVVPDVTFLLDIDPAEGLYRTERNQLGFSFDNREEVEIRGKEGRRFEKMTLDFHQRVREGYLALAECGRNWMTLSADKDVDEIRECIWGYVQSLSI